ncbi:hypothetical protein VCRA2113O118_30015 [Vibrio crassostreae]|nr:hypothetical protein VCRA2110O113_330016 [Vibrio crassostreae]CAK2011714.1 hypothetical protein VCRA2114E123_350015 [Vibrio crassostreae]CAK2013666.1 hypothetical protein VCRA2114E122_350007 [Vibrio crassostreae]CAK2088582.1 hypothetical protein VCRA2113O119_420007 [Vibrio crassostreae]CAK2333165.1 hypothetical protein VCRA2112O114_380006 [Vibrio crassostreae]
MNNALQEHKKFTFPIASILNFSNSYLPYFSIYKIPKNQ